MRLIVETGGNNLYYGGYSRTQIDTKFAVAQQQHTAVAALRAFTGGFGWSTSRWGVGRNHSFSGAMAAFDGECTVVQIGNSRLLRSRPPSDMVMARVARLNLLVDIVDQKARKSLIRTARLEGEAKVALLAAPHLWTHVVRVGDPRIVPFLRPNRTAMLVLADYLEENAISYRHADAIRAVDGDPVLSYTVLASDQSKSS